MQEGKLKWCFRLKDGLNIVNVNERLAKVYLEEAKSSLERAEKNFRDGDLLWTTVVIYYAEYYALYSFLQMIGVKCENHSCSILAVNFLLGDDKV
ncbi:MAG: HEPN domain-containing protein, partial [Nanoarchaeota archaeon]